MAGSLTNLQVIAVGTAMRDSFPKLAAAEQRLMIGENLHNWAQHKTEHQAHKIDEKWSLLLESVREKRSMLDTKPDGAIIEEYLEVLGCLEMSFDSGRQDWSSRYARTREELEVFRYGHQEFTCKTMMERSSIRESEWIQLELFDVLGAQDPALLDDLDDHHVEVTEKLTKLGDELRREVDAWTQCYQQWEKRVNELNKQARKETVPFKSQLTIIKRHIEQGIPLYLDRDKQATAVKVGEGENAIEFDGVEVEAWKLAPLPIKVP